MRHMDKEIEIDLIAREFSKSLLSALGPDVMREVVERNRSETIEGVCHSHDFCDANMIMAPAFVAVVGREPEASSDRDAALWSAAWARAFAYEFWQGYEDMEGAR